MIYLFIFLFLSCILMGLDFFKKINLINGIYQIPLLIILPHFIPCFYFIFKSIFRTEEFYLTVLSLFSLLQFSFIFVYIIIRLHFFPLHGICDTCPRVWILYGGRKILLLAIGGILLQCLLYLCYFAGWISFLPAPALSISSVSFYIVDIIGVFLFLSLLFLNGLLRMLFTCYRLGIVKRIVIFFIIWIPVVNIYPLYYLCKKTKEEYALECCRFENSKQRNNQLYCSTKYPLILLHGIGFRDLNFFNYWGRIPKNLVKNGAVVYYGHQEAWGTIENNAAFIKDKIEEILKLHHCEKVNIIAHSKGGLDARYLISGLHMEDKIASLTTISTPHKGSELIAILNKLPDSLYQKISCMIDKTFKKAGDTNPDCYHSSKQLDPDFCVDFNCRYPNSPKVYYQSYTSVLKGALSDTLLSVPHILMNAVGAKKNDGLVTEESSKWGEYKGTFCSNARRGISHGDMIDLKREDYKGFDVIEAYLNIVHELSLKGF